ncbi:MAG: CorA family divalent cation transporter, partial [Nitrososphaeraceae archaeon]
MMEHPEESLWIHADDRSDIFRLQDVFGLHPSAIEAIIHTHQPSKVEEYDAYLFTIIDGVNGKTKKLVEVEREKDRTKMAAAADLPIM